MKGINLKKIGAIVAGTAILASSVAFAPLYYGDTMLVTDSGQPVAKVVVGSGAAASDGVAAANIAAHLAHNAFMSDTYTAKVGDVTCVATGEGSTCTITDKSVTLDVTVPGAVSTGTVTINTLVGDYIDRTLGNRGKGSSPETYAAANSEKSIIANPFSDGSSSLMSGAPTPSTYLHQIDGNEFAPFADYTVNDEDASSSYKEVQYMWLGSESGSGGDVLYSESEDDLILNLPLLVYQLKFEGSDDLGIPVCTQSVNTSLYADCQTNAASTLDESYKTAAHKVKVMFLGEEWIISEMQPPTGSVTDEQTVTPGGHVKLAKESIQDVLNKGDSLKVGDLEFVLDDVSLATGANNVHPAILSVFATGVDEPLVKGEQINPGVTEDVLVEGYGTFKVHVYETAPGYTFGATWADLAIFSEELKLESGSDVDPDKDKNDYWKVLVGWKNKGATNSNDNGDPDHLRTILLYSDEVDDLLDETADTDDWTTGVSVPVVQDPAAWQLSFLGLDIDSSDRNNLNFKMERDSQRQVSINSSAKCNISAPYVEISGPDAHKFTLDSATDPDTATTTSGYDSKAYVALRDSTTAINCDSGQGYRAGSIIMKSSSASDSFVAKNNTGTLDLKWDYAGASQSWSSGGVIRVSTNAGNATAANFGTALSGEAKLYVLFGFAEEAGESESVNTPTQFLWGVNYTGTNGASSTFNFDGASSTTYFDKDDIFVQFAGPAYTSNKTMEEGYISERGSVFKEISDTTVKFDVADQVGHAQIQLATAETASVAPNTVRLSDLMEGDTADVPGTDVSVTVVEIMATGSCDTGAGATPVCEVSGTGSAFLEDSTGANVGTSVEAVTMYSGSVSDMVVLDTDVSTGTMVSVGGPMVNSVTEAAQAEGDFSLDASGDTVVTQVGNTIVVAGYTADDTMAAAEEFLAALN